MKKKFLEFFSQNKPYLLLLTAVAILIAAASISFSQSIMGWDNFSISLNLELNWMRTLLSSWREYRGLGTPGDSEQVDVVRFVFFFLLRIILWPNLIEQVYYLLLYFTGVVAIYFLALEVFFRQKKARAFIFEQKLAAFVAAIMYGFNFHTFETFFFPIVMYPTRFAFLPLLLLFSLRLLRNKGWNVVNGFGFVFVTVLLMPSYLTATVFITVLLSIFTLSLSIKKPVRIAAILLVFVLLNFSWLLQFAQYSKDNASSLTKASSFVETNQALLNKPIEDASWQNILTFYPTILSKTALPFTDPQSQQPVSFIKILDQQKVENQLLLLVPTFFAFIGLASLIIKPTKSKLNNLWLSLLVIGPLIVLRKEQWPFGFAYSFFSDYIPFFDIVFRFASTKFSPILLLGLSLLAALGLFELLKLIAKFIHHNLTHLSQLLLSLIVVVAVVTPFSFFFKQGLFSELVLVEVPPAYQKIADRINASREKGRVVHFPFDQFSYWKSYQWGYFGSSFFHLLIDQPLIDRTFEPASPTNDFFLSTVQQIVLGADIASPVELELKSDTLAQLLKLTGVSFVVEDGSVGTDIRTQNLRSWGVFNTKQFSALVSQLVNDGELTKVDQQRISVDNQKIAGSDSHIDPTLALFQTAYQRPSVEILDTVINIDAEIENGFSQPLLNLEQNFIQSDQHPFISFPFWQPKTEVIADESQYQLSIPVAANGVQGKLVRDASSAALISDVFISRQQQELAVYIQPRYFPTQVEFDLNRAERFDFSELVGPLALQFADQVFSVEEKNIDQPSYLGSVIHTLDTEMTVYSLESEAEVSLSSVQLTEPPNCFEDKVEGYTYDFDSSPSSVQLETENGMTCLSAPIAVEEQNLSENQRLFATEVTFSSDLKLDEGSKGGLAVLSPSQKAARQDIESQPTYSSIQLCIIDPITGDCLNSHQLFQGKPTQSTQLLWADRATFEPTTNLLVVVPAAKNYQHQVTISNLRFSSYAEVDRVQFAQELATTSSQQIEIIDGEINLTIPQLVSADSFNSKQSAINAVQSTCQPISGTGYQTVGYNEGIISAFSENCTQALSTALPVKSDRSYVWLTHYFTESGRQPKQIIFQDNGPLYEQLLDRYYRYPDLSDSFAWSSLVVDPLDTQSPPGFINYQLQVQNEGQGEYRLRQMAITPIPQAWRSIRFETGNPGLDFAQASISQLEQFSPALYKVRLSDVSQTNNQPVLLNLNQAFNPGWKLYTAANWQSLVFGMREEVLVQEHIRVNGWSNGWIIAVNDLPSDQDIYIWYAPQQLIIWGSVVSVITAVGFLSLVMLTAKRKQKSSKSKKVTHQSLVHSTFLGKQEKKK